MRTLTYRIANFTTTSLARAMEVSEQVNIPYKTELIEVINKPSYNEKRVLSIKAKAMARKKLGIK